MLHHQFQFLTRLAVAAACLGTLTTSSTAGSFTRGCAARDMQVLMLIEERQSWGAISEQQSSDALLKMMHARIVCHEGHVPDALALYDSITEGILSDIVVTGRMR